MALLSRFALLHMQPSSRIPVIPTTTSLAAGRLLEVEQSVQAAVNGNGSSSGSRFRADVATRQQLEIARRQLDEAVAARSEAQAELQAVKATLAREQKQVRQLGQLGTGKAEVRQRCPDRQAEQGLRSGEAGLCEVRLTAAAAI